MTPVSERTLIPLPVHLLVKLVPLMVPLLVLMTIPVVMTLPATVSSPSSGHLKCCPSGEALVRSGDQGEPVCAPAPLDSHTLRHLHHTAWRKLLDQATGDLSSSVKHVTRYRREVPGSSARGSSSNNAVYETDPPPPPPSAHGNLSCARGYFWLTSDLPSQSFSLLLDGALRRGDARYPVGGHCSDLLLDSGGYQIPTLAARVCHIPLLGAAGKLTAAESAVRCGSARRCFRKCCPEGMLIQRGGLRCVPAESPWTPVFHREENPLDAEPVRLVTGVPACAEPGEEPRGVFPLEPDRPPPQRPASQGSSSQAPDKTEVHSSPSGSEEASRPHPDRFFLQEDGQLLAPEQAMIPAGEFCVDRVLYEECDEEQETDPSPTPEPSVSSTSSADNADESTVRYRTKRRNVVTGGNRAVRSRERRHQHRKSKRSNLHHSTLHNIHRKQRVRRGGTISSELTMLSSIPRTARSVASPHGGPRPRLMAVLCYPRPAAVPRPGPPTLLTVLQTCSAVGLLGVLLVHLLVPALRNQHGRCLVSHAAALLVALGCLMASSRPAVYSRLELCQGVGLLMHFSFLASCFWLNVMSFDIWLTFSRLRAAPSRTSQQRERFVRYSLYAWCSPLLLTLLTALMQFVPGEQPLLPPPGIGRVNCWFPGSREMLIYFHWPILALMTANLFFFLVTACNLRRGEKNAERVRSRKRGVERFKIYVHLFVVMGVSWIAEGLSKHFGPNNLWLVADLFNSLQGVLIFLLLVLRGGTRRALRRQVALWWRQAARRTLSSSSGRRSRSTSASSRQTVPTTASARQSTHTSARQSGHASAAVRLSVPMPVSARRSLSPPRRTPEMSVRWRSKSVGSRQVALVSRTEAQRGRGDEEEGQRGRRGRVEDEKEKRKSHVMVKISQANTRAGLLNGKLRINFGSRDRDSSSRDSINVSGSRNCVESDSSCSIVVSSNGGSAVYKNSTVKCGERAGAGNHVPVESNRSGSLSSEPYTISIISSQSDKICKASSESDKLEKTKTGYDESERTPSSHAKPNGMLPGSDESPKKPADHSDKPNKTKDRVQTISVRIERASFDSDCEIHQQYTGSVESDLGHTKPDSEGVESDSDSDNRDSADSESHEGVGLCLNRLFSDPPGTESSLCVATRSDSVVCQLSNGTGTRCKLAESAARRPRAGTAV
ncbi:uncharacterized protein LOC122365154 isoform X2 [Amphibalanus amphitrite]|uniref:uncharacterized protein LOC122365154 isoform X2 n=1 Tax=Amphibalanus amphitrite TaxID=1232801 RepID=UPI001C9098DB|nr:uncharacterized protein LOC122365154 isoform X2 [Amphibalanus amphitrite]